MFRRDAQTIFNGLELLVLSNKNIKVMKNILFLLIIISCFACRVKPKKAYTPDLIPKAPDYSNEANWAALPQKTDPADSTPQPDIKDNQQNAPVDVFFLHPTTYVGQRGEKLWNAPVDDESLNKKTDNSTILHQASIFNGAGKVYAPRYRQAHFESYFTKDTASAIKAFDLAYQDVKAAFDYYLLHYNKGRPIIIASHSQGTTHSIRLVKEYFDNKPLAKQLVVAYLVGIPVTKDAFEKIKPCQDEEELACFCAWRTWKKGHYPKEHVKGNNIVVTNPLSWKTDNNYVPPTFNKGAVLKKFEAGLHDELVGAEVHDGILWVNKPKFFGSIFITFKNYHIADYNFFYMNVRENAIERTAIYLKAQDRN